MRDCVLRTLGQHTLRCVNNSLPSVARRLSPSPFCGLCINFDYSSLPALLSVDPHMNQIYRTNPGRQPALRSTVSASPRWTTLFHGCRRGSGTHVDWCPSTQNSIAGARWLLFQNVGSGLGGSVSNPSDPIVRASRQLTRVRMSPMRCRWPRLLDRTFSRPTDDGDLCC